MPRPSPRGTAWTSRFASASTKALALDEELRATLPALLSPLDVPAEDPEWRALDPRQRRGRTIAAIKQLLA